MTHDLTLYYGPVTCARVSLVALEEVKQPFDLRLVDMMQNEQLSPGYLAVNPKGKVPALIVDGTVLTETPAILTWLARTFPEAGLLPLNGDPLNDAQVQADLTFISAGLHPIITRLCRSQYFCDIEGGPQRVHDMAAAALRPNFALVEARLAAGEWWFGKQWSMVDAYLGWIYYRAASTPFAVSDYPSFTKHSARLAERPSVRRAEERYTEALAKSEAAS